jgi:hypothetical protein
MTKKMSYMTVLCILSILFGCACLTPASSLANGPKLVIVKGSFDTTASNGPGGQVINIDVVGGAALPLTKIKRYTVTLQLAQLTSARAGIDRVEVYVGVLEGSTAYDVRVIRQDPATASPLPYPGMTILPYTGTNSYIKVYRGADGLGPVKVRFNAYVEVEP